ncbi:hypothetical protein P5P86_13800 [Nocardioides sp. BP30]|uniref:hypothetical protein n=1 Tax=Nocardioides sp. BP30 TaxID=3036374 RepID=UPI00246892C1|nr:hypothetical protein [Nocardioides sp. BP30]WGL51036.1 hypothetical protein P5P86_13800 [Nocardioides sp. BP30]
MAVAAPPYRDLTHAQRLDASRGLLDVASATLDPALRRVVLREVAALNAEDALAVVKVLYRRQRSTPIDEPGLLAVALEVYVDAVLALDPSLDGDVLPRVLPALRAAVTRFNRALVARHNAPGVGGRSGLR